MRSVVIFLISALLLTTGSISGQRGAIDVSIEQFVAVDAAREMLRWSR